MAAGYFAGMAEGSLGWLGPRGRDGGIDTVPLPVPTSGPLPASAGLSLCGKHAIGPDYDAAMNRCGASTVVCLVEAYELEDRYPEYLAWLRSERGGRAIWHPIHDLHAPPLDDARALLGELTARLERGEHLLMHCAAGIGRAGTMAACLLVEL